MGNSSSKIDNDIRTEDQIDQISDMEDESDPIKIDQNSHLTDIISAKENLDYEYIVFSGGGIKGDSFCGALDVLNKLDVLNHNIIKGFAGASAGSIVATLLAIGYTPAEIKEIMLGLNMTDLIDGTTSYIREGLNFAESYGLVPGTFMHQFLGKLIKDKTGSDDYTIEQLFEEKKIKLVIVTTDMNMGKSRYFYPGNPIDSDSKIPIRQAVRMSVGIPFLFEPVIHLNNYHVDGGVLDNYPIHVFDGEYPGDLNAKNNTVKPNPKVLGLRIVSEPNQTGGSTSSSDQNERTKIDSLIQYGVSFISAFMAENNRRELTPANELRTIRIITPYYPLTTFTISTAAKNELIECGTCATSNFFQSHLEKNNKIAPI